MMKLTEDNQGYWDRIKRAVSWISRAQALESEGAATEEPADSQELFVMYWIAFNALYGRVNETGHGRYLRPGDDDARWFLRRVCDLDAGAERIRSAATAVRKNAQKLLKSRYLSEAYWREGYTKGVKDSLNEETAAAESALDDGDLHGYLTTLLWGRIRVLRNQIFHGCSTHQASLNREAVDPAVQVLSVLIPAFVETMKARGDKENEWPRIPFPRRDSPQHPKVRHRQ